MECLKLRQRVLRLNGEKAYHHYGFIDGGFIAPLVSSNNLLKNAEANSEQFTGLNDKNKKPIYAGDLIRHAGQDGEVIYRKGAFMVRTHDRFGAMVIYCLHELYSPEIIGNAWQDNEKKEE